MRCADLFCGRGGWSKGFLAAGYEVVGFDNEPQPDYPAEFVLADITAMQPEELLSFDTIVASPPCTEFSRWGMPWTRRRAKEPSLILMKQAFHLCKESGARWVIENVREAQHWFGPASTHYGPYYLWGNVPPPTRYKERSKESYSSKQTALRAEIPFKLAYLIAVQTTLSVRNARI